MSDEPMDEVLPDVHLFRGVLKALILEMAVQEFSSPQGLAHRLLELGKEASTDGNGHKEERPKIDPKNLPPGFHSKGSNRRQLDPMNWQAWRRLLVSYALSNNNQIMLDELPYDPAEHGGIPLGSSNASPLLAYMVKNGELTRLGNGAYKLTPEGRKRAAQMGIAPDAKAVAAAPAPAPVAAPAPKVHAEPETPAPKRGRPKTGTTSTAANISVDLMRWAAEHDGTVAVGEFRKARKYNNATVFDALKMLQDDDKLERIDRGKYKLVGEYAEPASTEASKPEADDRSTRRARPAGHWYEVFTKASSEIGEPWDWARFKEHTGYDSAEMSKAYPSMNQAIKKKVMKRTADGRFTPTAATSKAMAAAG